MQSGSGAERARWMELPGQSQDHFARLTGLRQYRAAHLLGVRAPGHELVTLGINLVLLNALQHPNPKIPYFEQRYVSEGKLRGSLYLLVGTSILSSLVEREGLGSRYQAILFLRHEKLGDEGAYLDILDSIIEQSNPIIREMGGQPVPTLRESRYPLDRLFGSGS